MSHGRVGKDYVLLTGTNKYVNMNKLSNPVFDMRTITEKLGKNYVFVVDSLANPILQGIHQAIRKYSALQFNDDDQLFIFIAGHGEFGDNESGSDLLFIAK